MQAPVKDYIWGGTKLKTNYHKFSNSERLAESWELSCHPDGPSIISNGADKGKSLAKFIEENGKRVLGEKCAGFDRFPIMIKLIDAKENLSVQVHPDNEYALEHEGEYGKTEMWYVLEAEPGAELLYGMEKATSLTELKNHLENGTITDICRHVPVHKGDVFFIPAGTIHGIGAGIVVAEVQQNSNTTYRLYDYDRVGADGKPRQLHIQQAIDVCSLKPLPSATKWHIEELSPTCKGRLLASCDYFKTYAVDITSTVTLTAGKESFQSFTVLEGTLVLAADGTKLTLQPGKTVFIPADMGDYALTGTGQILFTTL